MANNDQEPASTSQLTETQPSEPSEKQSALDVTSPTHAKAPSDITSTVSSASAENAPDKTPATQLDNSKSALNPTRPSLVQLGSSSGQTSSAPKRFSAMNINKKFLEKNSSSTSTTTSSTAVASKPGSQAPRPQAQLPSSHSRLVTTKLTATSPVSSASGVGWSRPSSAAPPNASGTHSPNGTSPHPTNASLSAPAPSAIAQLPHVGKLIQPQPRSVVSQPSLTNKDTIGALSSSKSAWGNIRSAALTSRRPDVRQDDFPTAAEVAQGRANKLTDVKESSEATMKRVMLEEADTFRGVHLDPNAHHWDEMEEDDDAFLPGVIEFGDGRQYRIESTYIPPESSQISDDSTSHAQSRSEAAKDTEETPGVGDGPVSKEERFADDFDRSWPKSHTSPLPSPRISGLGLAAPSSAAAKPQTSPQEPSRVLFNERSNRLEPYTSSHRAGQQAPKRGRESSISPVERLSGPSHHVHLLQKSAVVEGSARSRRFSGGAGPSQQPPRRDLPPLTRDNGPLPAGRGRSREGNRMGPPSAKEPRFNISPVVPHTTLPSQSPVAVHASTNFLSPKVLTSPLPSISSVELDEVRKDLMQSAAARAKQRRQQEEEEREKEKERARRKAAELEERLKAAEAEKATPDGVQPQENAQDHAVIAVIEDAIRMAESSQPEQGPTAITSQPARQGQRRPPSQQPIPRQPSGEPSGALRRMSISAPGIVAPISAVPTPATVADSWRSKAGPVPSSVTQASPVSAFQPPPSSVLDNTLTGMPAEDLEVVDFSDMAKFVGVSDDEHEESQSNSRPVASDFFDDDELVAQPLAEPRKMDGVNWRQKALQGPLSVGRPPRTEPEKDQSPADDSKQSIPQPGRDFESFNTSTAKEASPDMHPHHFNGQRLHRTQNSYKDPSMSALDDAMSRIKGALDGMQSSEASREISFELDSVSVKTFQSSARRERWIPPALRPRVPDHEREEFRPTGCDPPRSPKSALDTVTVHLRPMYRPVELVNKRQLYLSSKPAYLRWDILSFDPPVEGMNKRDLSLNDVLFRWTNYKGRFRYRVSLPRPGPRVSFPPHNSQARINGQGAFGRVAGADSTTTWRKPATLTEKVDSDEPVSDEIGLNTTSRSPPPEMARSNFKEEGESNEKATVIKVDGTAPARSRSQPKMPAGTAVAFYRDSRIDAVSADSKSSVNFIVTSELDEPRMQLQETPQQANSTASPFDAQASLPDAGPQAQSDLSSTTLDTTATTTSRKSRSKDTVDLIASTSPKQYGTPWTRSSLSSTAKDSAARAPDPEHLKAVWSQTSDKAGLHGVNSLEGIGDDLTSLPFTLQDVKSEDGETPPPVPAAPSRMSLHDVTRAFQQVPTSSSSNSTSSQRAAPAPAARPSYNYTLSPPSNSARPAYAAYPSPIMSHSPSPGAMYPYPVASSPVPSRMSVNGQPSLYSQPMWATLPASTPQNPTGMMRPMTSPYHPQMMSYPSPATPSMYPPMTTMSPPQQGAMQAGRGRSLTMMSPVVQNAAPQMPPQMYASPILMHAPVMPVPQSPAYMHMPVARPQGRAENGQMALPQQAQLNHASYNATALPFVRPTW